MGVNSDAGEAVGEELRSGETLIVGERAGEAVAEGDEMRVAKTGLLKSKKRASVGRSKMTVFTRLINKYFTPQKQILSKNKGF
jgi:hypothetical protein